MKIEIGTVLIANNPCKMTDFDFEALILGKEYPVHAIFKNEAIINSEFTDNHHFDIDELDLYFTIKPTFK